MCISARKNTAVNLVLRVWGLFLQSPPVLWGGECFELTHSLRLAGGGENIPSRNLQVSVGTSVAAVEVPVSG